MAQKHDFHKVIIGRSEVLSFTDIDVLKVPAKADTGAYRSAVHASNIAVNAEGVLSFDLLGGHPVCGALARTVQTSDFTEVTVANSFGHEERRYEVKLRVKIGPKVFPTRFTLANRSKKIYPILLGRKLLSGRFLVDPGESSIDRALLRQQYNIDFPLDEEGGR